MTDLRRLPNLITNNFPFAGFVFFDGVQKLLTLYRNRLC